MFSNKMNYHDYLQIDKLLNAQKLASETQGKPAHDEMLFIIVHQVYELWFKQILTEVDSVLKIFGGNRVDESLMDLIVSRLQRVVEIQKLLIDQIRVMETMTPLDFLEFRDLLIPASGFQSLQFRTVEARLGLKRENRLTYNQTSYDQALKPDQRGHMQDVEAEPSLFDRVEQWLERTPFLKMGKYDFWQSYQKAVETSLLADLQLIQNNPALSQQELERNRLLLESSLASFRGLFNESAYNEARGRGEWRLSHRAAHAALLIQLYRDQPALQLPFRLLTTLMDMDELFTTWRSRHALMAKRMLGAKVGTGGSSGYQYLRDAADKHKIFSDLFQLTTFFVPRSKIPPLPPAVQQQLGFFYSSSGQP